VRIVAGAFSGRRLRAVPGHGTRPTADRVREALFSRLDSRYGIEGRSVLDVFAGTGALALEALSRGAARAVCIEVGRGAMETLRANVRELGLASRVRVMGDDFRRSLGVLAREGRRFDGVFVDPPYDLGLAVEALEALAGHGLVAPGGWVSVERSRRESLPEAVGGATGAAGGTVATGAASVAGAAQRVAGEAADEPPGAGGAILRRVREDTYGDTVLALYECVAEGEAGPGDASDTTEDNQR